MNDFWPFLAIFVALSTLNDFRRFWPILTDFGRFWVNTAPFEIFGDFDETQHYNRFFVDFDETQRLLRFLVIFGETQHYDRFKRG